MTEAETLCNRVAFLNKGKIQLLDSPKALRRKFSDDTFTVELKDGRSASYAKWTRKCTKNK